jgi:hypothetical protein
MASARVRFSPGFPLGGGFPAEQSNLLQSGGKRPRRRGEVAPVEFNCSLGEGVPERVAPAVFGFPQRREFPLEQSTTWM